jgi:AAA15 family ATPase/GTPase
MRIKEMNLVNFKRFTDLQIKNIPAEAKLVLLIGANGSGKSSIFDAFDWFGMDKPISSRTPSVKDKILYRPNEYYPKNANKAINLTLVLSNGDTSHKREYQETITRTGLTLSKKAFFGRPSMRIVPTLTNTFYDEQVIEDNSDGPMRYTEADTRINTDIKKFTRDLGRSLRDPLFAGETSVNLVEIAQRFIKPVNESLERIFGNDKQTSIYISNFEDAGSTENEPPRLFFKKGNYQVNYDLLSHGEKQIIIILMNFIVRSKHFQDSIYYIDEMDVHLNTTLQYALLKEITENWIPKNCQLWTATHSLGFIEYAKDADLATIIDLDNLDFDKRQSIEPLPKYQDDVFEIAVPRASLSKILGNRKIVLCENKNYELYSLMGLDDFIFTDVQNSNSVFLKIKRDKTLVGLRDRDFLTDNEIQKLSVNFPNYKVLRYYCFENYLYHPENVVQINLAGFDKDVYENEITAIKNTHRHALVLKISESRRAYEEFRDGGIKADNDIAHLSKYLESDDFETFYPFFNFKDYGGVLINKYKMGQRDIKEKLVQTEWFIGKIKHVLN